MEIRSLRLSSPVVAATARGPYVYNTNLTLIVSLGVGTATVIHAVVFGISPSTENGPRICLQTLPIIEVRTARPISGLHVNRI